jgi:lipopolysaccharide/colanic/teichoic acid biosynthesis glycosyltransferase
VVGAAAGLVVAGPFMAGIALLIRMSDGGPVFFRQVRVGRHGVPFRIWKFRTMMAGTGQQGPEVTAAGDPRITPLGAALRRLKLDELPQLLNIIAGEMSFVGPRPEVPRFVAAYTSAEQELLAYTPGLTDPASLAYRHEAELLASADDPELMYRELIMPEKARLSLNYARSATPWSDLRIIAGTLRAMVRHRAADDVAPRPSSLDRLSPGAH